MNFGKARLEKSLPTWMQNFAHLPKRTNRAEACEQIHDNRPGVPLNVQIHPREARLAKELIARLG